MKMIWRTLRTFSGRLWGGGGMLVRLRYCHAQGVVKSASGDNESDAQLRRFHTGLAVIWKCDLEMHDDGARRVWHVYGNISAICLLTIRVAAIGCRTRAEGVVRSSHRCPRLSPCSSCGPVGDSNCDRWTGASLQLLSRIRCTRGRSRQGAKLDGGFIEILCGAQTVQVVSLQFVARKVDRSRQDPQTRFQPSSPAAQSRPSSIHPQHHLTTTSTSPASALELFNSSLRCRSWLSPSIAPSPATPRAPICPDCVNLPPRFTHDLDCDHIPTSSLHSTQLSIEFHLLSLVSRPSRHSPI
jgi:hypothetical protein